MNIRGKIPLSNEQDIKEHNEVKMMPNIYVQFK